MAMQGFQFMKEKPWNTLFLHGLVRDAKGQKMSKSKGHTVDPLGLVDKYGADALRFPLAAMESQGRDIKLPEERGEGHHTYANKLRKIGVAAVRVSVCRYELISGVAV